MSTCSMTMFLCASQTCMPIVIMQSLLDPSAEQLVMNRHIVQSAVYILHVLLQSPLETG
jgi:hypothetical protein